MNLWAILQSLMIVAFANTAPLVAKKVFGARFCHPVDGGLTFFDKRPLLGSSKTIRGIVASILAAVVGALLVGVDPRVGVLMAAAAMAGDLLASFVKRRLDLLPRAARLWGSIRYRSRSCPCWWHVMRCL